MKSFNCKYIVTCCFRLIAEKINKNERKGRAEIIVLTQNNEEKGFWDALNVVEKSDIVLVKVWCFFLIIFDDKLKTFVYHTDIWYIEKNA